MDSRNNKHKMQAIKLKNKSFRWICSFESSKNRLNPSHNRNFYLANVDEFFRCFFFLIIFPKSRRYNKKNHGVFKVRFCKSFQTVSFLLWIVDHKAVPKFFNILAPPPSKKVIRRGDKYSFEGHQRRSPFF